MLKGDRKMGRLRPEHAHRPEYAGLDPQADYEVTFSTSDPFRLYLTGADTVVYVGDKRHFDVWVSNH